MSCLLSNPLALLILLGGLSGEAAHWLDVPFLPQTHHGCGAACIAMVQRYWEPDIPKEEPAEILRSLLDPSTNGIPARRMEKYFRLRNYRVFVFRGAWADLVQHIARGRPLIVSFRDPQAAPAHYAVVAGTDPDKQMLQLNDPARGKLVKMRRTDFERAWQQCDNWTLLALPPDKP